MSGRFPLERAQQTLVREGEGGSGPRPRGYPGTSGGGSHRSQASEAVSWLQVDPGSPQRRQRGGLCLPLKGPSSPAGLGWSAPGPQASASWEGLPSEPQAHPVPAPVPHPRLPPRVPASPGSARFLRQAKNAGPQAFFQLLYPLPKGSVSVSSEFRHLARWDPSLLG